MSFEIKRRNGWLAVGSHRVVKCIWLYCISKCVPIEFLWYFAKVMCMEINGLLILSFNLFFFSH